MQTTTLQNEHFEIITVEISPGVKAGQRLKGNKCFYHISFYLASTNRRILTSCTNNCKSLAHISWTPKKNYHRLYSVKIQNIDKSFGV